MARFFKTICKQISGNLLNMTMMTLYDSAGQRLYLNRAERAAFLHQARHLSVRDRSLCETLHYTGCRVSEVLQITPAQVDLSAQTLVIRSLKKRARTDGTPIHHARSIPVPAAYLDRLDAAYDLRKAQSRLKRAHRPIWPISRVRVWQIVTQALKAAQIAPGPHRSPKGLRHGFGVHAVLNDVPLHMLQKWLGHAHLSTTAIYANATGPEELALVARMWAQDEI
jgi:site-specific recombinase XerD